MIGARASFCAGHSLPQHPGVHGHSYEVWAYVESGCAEELQRWVKLACQELDHQMLNNILPEPTMESIAQFVASRIPGGAARVIVNRPVEGLCCEYHRGDN